MNTIHILKEEGRARLGIVRTQHGDIDTPVFIFQIIEYIIGEYFIRSQLCM